MERLFHALLFSGLCLFTQNISCEYVLVQEQKTWDEAQVYCRQNFMDLVTVERNEEWTHLQETAQLATTSAWTGLYNDINSWRWTYKDEKVTMMFWSSGEPDNIDGKEEFVFMDKGTWRDVYGGALLNVFCYDENQTGSNRFILVLQLMNWHSARSYCIQFHTDLAIIRSKEENDILTLTQGHNPTWIGLYRNSWRWSDGTNVSMSFFNWMSTTLHVFRQMRPCGAKVPKRLIEDQLCSNALPFICMHHPMKQIVRLEVKSGLNVNDPAVMDTILQWIRQKLKVHGIEQHTIVSWRLQPDGKVFFSKP